MQKTTQHKGLASDVENPPTPPKHTHPPTHTAVTVSIGKVVIGVATVGRGPQDGALVARPGTPPSVEDPHEEKLELKAVKL